MRWPEEWAEGEYKGDVQTVKPRPDMAWHNSRFRCGVVPLAGPVLWHLCGKNGKGKSWSKSINLGTPSIATKLVPPSRLVAPTQTFGPNLDDIAVLQLGNIIWRAHLRCLE